MNDNVENLILAQLREMRGELADMRADMARIEAKVDEGFDDQTQRVNGIALILTMLAGHVHSIEERVEKLETSR